MNLLRSSGLCWFNKIQAQKFFLARALNIWLLPRMRFCYSWYNFTMLISKHAFSNLLQLWPWLEKDWSIHWVKDSHTGTFFFMSTDWTCIMYVIINCNILPPVEQYLFSFQSLLAAEEFHLMPLIQNSSLRELSQCKWLHGFLFIFIALEEP